MNSPLASSKRFLVHENDYQKLVPEGTIEYLIEFQLKDSAAIKTFETAYADAGLEANGPTLTNALFKLINGLSDGIMIAIILLVGLLIVLIALMCIRFTLLTKIEEDYQEIGTMKAIGLRIVDIKKIYLAKYALLSLIGCLTGLSFAFIFSQPLLENIRLYLGESSYANWSVPLATVSSLTVFFMVIGYIQFLLRKFRKLSAASAIRTGSPEEKITTSRYLSLSKNNLLSTNLFLGIKDVFARKKLYATMLIVLFLASFMMIIPWNTYQTIADSSFSKYLGFGEMDLMVSMYQSDAPIEREQQINHSLEQNSQIKQFVQVTSKSFKVKKTDGSEEKLVIEMGDHDAFPIEYNSGQAPQNENEIALSSLNAVEFDKTIGDSIEIITNQGTRQMTVSGIYSNIFNGGKTAKANFEDSTAPTLWLNYYIQLHQQQEIQGVMTQLTKEFPFAKVTDAQNHKQQVFGSMISSIQTAAIIAFLVALFITGLVSLLFMRLLVAKDRVEIAMLKSLGFTNQDISRQYVTRSTFVLIISVFSGSILANTLGETIVSMAVSSFG
ncbi:MAG TPA: FtsX-like permease family protein, partial [Enterococcus sp.]|nr:FtsX-like permease family protein [Enterococcus sp.]